MFVFWGSSAAHANAGIVNNMLHAVNPHNPVLHIFFFILFPLRVFRWEGSFYYVKNVRIFSVNAVSRGMLQRICDFHDCCVVYFCLSSQTHLQAGSNMLRKPNYTRSHWKNLHNYAFVWSRDYIMRKFFKLVFVTKYKEANLYIIHKLSCIKFIN